MEGLFVLSFAFPTRPAWLRELARCGAEPVATLQSQTFVVRAGAAQAILGCPVLRYVAWVDPLLSTDRLSPDLFATGASSFWLQFVRGADPERVKESLPAARL